MEPVKMFESATLMRIRITLKGVKVSLLKVI